MKSSPIAWVALLALLALTASASASWAEMNAETIAEFVDESVDGSVADQAPAAAPEQVAEFAEQAETATTSAAAEAENAFESVAEVVAEAEAETAAAVAEELRDANAETAQSVAEAHAESEAPDETVAQTPTQAEADPGVEQAAAKASPSASPARLGPVGYDEQGRAGRIHVVRRGDTLWDISDAYLGTPWVWPSIWTDNAAIANPHLIRPGDRIWITPDEMRRVTPAEAERLLAGEPRSQVLPAAFDDANLASRAMGTVPTYRYTELDTTGFVSVAEYSGAATIVDSIVPRQWLADHDGVEIGFGRGEVAPGDRFEIFRPAERVVHPHTGELFGYSTEVLGWLEVEKVHDESATANIRASRSEIRRGDYLLPREPRSADIPLAAKPDVDGLIIHTPSQRRQMALTDVVYLNRGTADGVQVGSPLEVFRPLGSGFDPLRGDERKLRDHVVAKLIVVDATSDASVAVVTHAELEINRGDRFRGSDSLGW